MRDGRVRERVCKREREKTAHQILGRISKLGVKRVKRSHALLDSAIADTEISTIDECFAVARRKSRGAPSYVRRALELRLLLLEPSLPLHLNHSKVRLHTFRFGHRNTRRLLLRAKSIIN